MDASKPEPATDRSREPFTLVRGRTPLLVSLPHIGTQLPDDIAARMVPRARDVENTDWHLDRVYRFAEDLGAGLLMPRWSRFVVDLNRPPEDAPMYPGANNTGLAPRTFFSGDALYRPGHEPTPEEIVGRVDRYWRPYHDALGAELARLKAEHGHALLWEGHSIQSELPWLFQGRLPDLNLGTASGASCAPAIRARLQSVLDGQQHFTHVTDGRFKGGYITRHYGQPGDGVHAVQMEMTFSTYLAGEHAPWALDDARLARLQPVLRALLEAMLQGPRA